jgi:hypothetical protein
MDQEYQFASRVTLPLNSMVFGELPPLKKKQRHPGTRPTRLRCAELVDVIHLPRGKLGGLGLSETYGQTLR